MNKDKIRDIIFHKQKTNEELTSTEKKAALKHFSAEEIECMAMPEFNHDTCFSKKHTITVPKDQIEQFDRETL
jgi:hypothetical protein